MLLIGTKNKPKYVSKTHAYELLAKIIQNNTKFKNTYFWSSPANASGRRSYKNYNSFFYHFYFRYAGATYTIYADFSVTCTCKNIYIDKLYKIDNSQCTIARLKKIIK